MRKIINYMRQCFCNHDFELLQQTQVYKNTDCNGITVTPYIIGTRWAYRCKKCGYFKVERDY